MNVRTTANALRDGTAGMLLILILMAGCADQEEIDTSGVREVKGEDSPVSAAPATYSVSRKSRLVLEEAGAAAVAGQFEKFSGQFAVLQNLPANVGGHRVVIETDSLTGDDAARVEQLQSAWGFDANRHPHTILVFDRIEISGDEARMSGGLQVRGESLPFDLAGRFLRQGRDIVLSGNIPFRLPSAPPLSPDATGRDFVLRFDLVAAPAGGAAPVPGTGGISMLERSAKNPAAELAKQRLLERFDVDNDGKISEEERRVISETFTGRFDRDGDGKVSAEERKAAGLKRRTVVPGPPVDPKEASKAMIANLDRDGDGRIDPKEAGESRWRMLRQADADRDGLLSEEELASGRVKFSQPAKAP